MNNVKDTIDALGRDALKGKLKVGSSALSNAIDRETFPSSWYLPMQELAELKDVELNDSLFKWQGSAA